MGRSREALMRAPPLEFKDSFTFCAYANRRIFPGLGILMGASDEEEASLGNWQKGQTMSAHDSAHNEICLLESKPSSLRHAKKRRSSMGALSL